MSIHFTSIFSKSKSFFLSTFMNTKIMAFPPFRLYYRQMALVTFMRQIFQYLHYYSKLITTLFHQWACILHPLRSSTYGVIISRMFYMRIYPHLVQFTICFSFSFFQGFNCWLMYWLEAKMPSCLNVLSTTFTTWGEKKG